MSTQQINQERLEDQIQLAMNDSVLQNNALAVKRLEHCRKILDEMIVEEARKANDTRTPGEVGRDKIFTRAVEAQRRAVAAHKRATA